MQSIRGRLAGEKHDTNWVPAIGWAVRNFIFALGPASFRKLNRSEILDNIRWMGPGSIPLVTFSAAFISLALTTQAVLELQKFNAQDMAGALIAIGLLRELGPMTLSLAWNSHIAVYLSQELAELGKETDASEFILPRYIACLVSGISLSAYGLVIGLLSAAVYAHMLGVTSVADFMESARQSVHNKDIVVYFIKLVVLNPIVGFIVGCAYSRGPDARSPLSAAKCVSSTYIVASIANYAFTAMVYLP